MGQDGIGDIGEDMLRLVVVDQLRLVGEVAAGHHQKVVMVIEQQVMQRCVGEHGADAVLPRGDRWGERASGVWPEQDDGGCGAQQVRGLAGRDDAVPAQAGERARHHRERLGRSALAFPQAADGRLVGGEAGQVIAADALDRDGAAGPDQSPDGVANRRPVFEIVRPIEEAEPRARAAGGARIGLGVEAPVGGVVVFGAAGRAHGEPGHGRLRPVVGRAVEDAEPRAAVGAVGQRIGEAAVGGVADLG